MNLSVRENHEYSKEKYLEDFEKCALVAILPPSMLKSLHNKKIEEEIKSFLDKMQAGENKTGIVMNVVNGKPQFVHRTFAEFFTARWFSRNFKDNRSVMEKILFDREFRVIADMFNSMLARPSPLHCSMLNRDKERMEKLLKEGGDVNAVDKGGRSVTHIIATCLLMDSDIIKLILRYKASLDKRDDVLQWTPLQYAIKSENWFTVEALLENNVDRSGLEMIRQRKKNRNYIDPIIIQAAQYGQLSLLKFLCNIGENIHETSDRGFHSPLHAAIQGEKLQIVKLLIQHRVPCNT